MALSLKKNFGFALIGNLFYAASQYVILLLFIKMYSMEDVGTFVYAGAFTTPLMMALEMQLRNLYITEDGSYLGFRDYNTYRIITSSIGFIILCLIAYFVKYEYFVVIVIVTAIKTFESQLDLIYGVYQKEHRLDFVAYSRIIRGCVAIVVVFIATIISKNIVISLSAYLVSWISMYFFYERRQVVKRGFLTGRQLIELNFDLKKIKHFSIICIPVFFAIFIDKYYLNYPRVSVERLLGVEALAVFGSLLYFKSLGGQFITSLAQAAMPNLAKFIEKNQKERFLSLVLRMVLAGVVIGGVLVLGAYLWGPLILQLLYTEEYAKYNDVLLIILIGTTLTFGYSFITSSFTALRKQWVRLPMSIIMLVTIVVFFWVMKVESLLDVAYILLYSELINFVLFYLVFIVFFKKFFNERK